MEPIQLFEVVVLFHAHQVGASDDSSTSDEGLHGGASDGEEEGELQPWDIQRVEVFALEVRQVRVDIRESKATDLDDAGSLIVRTAGEAEAVGQQRQAAHRARVVAY